MASPPQDWRKCPLIAPLSLSSYSYPSSLNLLFSLPKPSFHFFSSFPSLRSGINQSSVSNRYSCPWYHRLSSIPLNTGGAEFSLQALPSHSEKVIQADGNGEGGVETRYLDKDKGQSTIDGIVLRLRNLGLGPDDEDQDEDDEGKGGRFAAVGAGRGGAAAAEVVKEEGSKKRRPMAPTLAELTIEDEELRRLRRIGMKDELVRLKFHEFLAVDMKTAHEIVENLTGGVLLLRNKYFIVIYRGKDFLPPSVPAALAERQDLTKQIQDAEEKLLVRAVEPSQSGEDKRQTPAEASKSKHARLAKRIKHELAAAQAKKLRAERLLSKIEASMIPAAPDYDQETITDEERAMFRRVGLRMKPYLPLGIRGVFDGVIENMHLHWKHRELVKLISKQKKLAFVEDTARLLEYESGGILVAIERAKALKRSVAMQRHEALSRHISELEKTIEQMKKEIGAEDVEDDNNRGSGEHGQFDPVSELYQSEDEASDIASDDDDEYKNELDDCEDDSEFVDDEDDSNDDREDDESLETNFNPIHTDIVDQVSENLEPSGSAYMHQLPLNWIVQSVAICSILTPSRDKSNETSSVLVRSDCKPSPFFSMQTFGFGPKVKGRCTLPILSIKFTVSIGVDEDYDVLPSERDKSKETPVSSKSWCPDTKAPLPSFSKKFAVLSSTFFCHNGATDISVEVGRTPSYLICVVPETCRVRESVMVKERLAPLNRHFGFFSSAIMVPPTWMKLRGMNGLSSSIVEAT
ncbi:hypothetical protein F3Y22_tig00110328pilonHSYRG00126 [Hibiscus syriacus]|uniref:CRM domain-containing protein n=1 Tax=Hibiscus syriacus TaxID=106335 RepID=A0A6A3B2T5_HIBSY|nr:hypothetical protein F3Y22_tig00110328pilonHSYRG00126 [Hibiscus syriacus]